MAGPYLPETSLIAQRAFLFAIAQAIRELKHVDPKLPAGFLAALEHHTIHHMDVMSLERVPARNQDELKVLLSYLHQVYDSYSRHLASSSPDRQAEELLESTIWQQILDALDAEDSRETRNERLGPD